MENSLVIHNFVSQIKLRSEKPCEYIYIFIKKEKNVANKTLFTKYLRKCNYKYPGLVQKCMQHFWKAHKCPADLELVLLHEIRYSRIYKRAFCMRNNKRGSVTCMAKYVELGYEASARNRYKYGRGCASVYFWRKVKSEIYMIPSHFTSARAKRLSNKYRSATKGKTVTEC